MIHHLASAAAFVAILWTTSAQAQSSAMQGIPVLHSSSLPGVDILPTDSRLKPLRRQLCGGIACRHGVTVHIKMPNGPDYVAENSFGGPYVFRGAIFIFPGETLSFEADAGSAGPTELTYVEQVVHPERTLTVSLQQPPDLAGGTGMRLTVSNPFGKALSFNVLEIDQTGVAAAAPGVCPVPPHASGRKNWLLPPSQAVISNLTFAANEQAEACAP